MANPFSICIVSHNGYGAVAGGQSGFIGGVEWQTSFLARWLAGRGHQVTFITWNEGGPAEETFNGVRVIKVCRRNAGVKGLRFFHPRWTSLLSALRRADADVYYHNSAEAMTGQVALWCRANRRPFVYSVASDADCDARLPQLHNALERALYRAGLRRASVRITQTERQRKQMQKVFGLGSVVVPLPCPAPAPQSVERDPRRVLWVGRVCPVKRPEWLLEVARLSPKLQFDVVGPVYEEEFSTSIKQRAATLRNVAMHGAVPRERMAEFYQRAGALCCTSEYEGFPNTFLEAWSYGLPIVATVNPGDLLTTRQLGIFADTKEDLAGSLQKLRDDAQLRGELSAAGKNYFQTNHLADAVLPRFETIFAELASRPAAAQVAEPVYQSR